MGDLKKLKRIAEERTRKIRLLLWYLPKELIEKANSIDELKQSLANLDWGRFYKILKEIRTHGKDVFPELGYVELSLSYSLLEEPYERLKGYYISRVGKRRYAGGIAALFAPLKLLGYGKRKYSKPPLKVRLTMDDLITDMRLKGLVKNEEQEKIVRESLYHMFFNERSRFLALVKTVFGDDTYKEVKRAIEEWEKGRGIRNKIKGIGDAASSFVDKVGDIFRKTVEKFGSKSGGYT